jgi:hypothetical protein
VVQGRDWLFRLLHHSVGEKVEAMRCVYEFSVSGILAFVWLVINQKNFISGVFGVSSDEYLNYAMQNRRQWEEQGEAVIAEMINNAEQAERTNAFVEEAQALYEGLEESSYYEV